VSSEALTPYLPILTLIVGIVGKGLFDMFQAKRTGTDAKMPTVAEIWDRMDGFEDALGKERNARLTLLEVFRSYVRRVQTGGTSDLTPQEQHALDQTTIQEEA
jgi:hypothetical protein